jgi:hypothetical protein
MPKSRRRRLVANFEAVSVQFIAACVIGLTGAAQAPVASATGGRGASITQAARPAPNAVTTAPSARARPHSQASPAYTARLNTSLTETAHERPRPPEPPGP